MQIETKSRVLVVDDEISIRNQLSTGLAQRGFETETSGGGFTAVEKIEAARQRGKPHHCVVLDIRLPDIDGLKLLQIIKARYPDVGVVVISGFGSEYPTEKVDEYDGSSYLDKPFELDVLEAEIARVGRPVKAVATSAGPEASVEAGCAKSAYVFIQGKPGADLHEPFTKLFFADGVCYCDAVNGEWDIVLLLQAPDRKGIEALVERNVKPLKDVQRYEIRHVARPMLSNDLEAFIRGYERMHAKGQFCQDTIDRRSRQMVSAYMLLGIERSRLQELYRKLYFHDNVVYCDVTDECDEAVLLLQGLTVPDLHQAVSGILAEPGVRGGKVLNVLRVLNCM